MWRVKILIFIIAVAAAGTCIGTAWWYYTRVIGKDDEIHSEIKKMQSNKQAPPDPGIRRFDMAVETIKSGNLDAGRDALYDLVKHFPSSKRTTEAKRIIGEMNMDNLFSAEKNPARKEYVVQPGNSLGLIATKNQTTIEVLLRANGMMTSGLQPGDHVNVFPLDFEVVYSISGKSVTLLRNGRFFKEYLAVNVKLPAGVKPDLVIEINDKAAWDHGRRVQSSHPNYLGADKWLICNKSGLNIRALPQAKTSDSVTVIAPHAAHPAANSKTPPKAATGKAVKPTKAAKATAADDNNGDEPVEEVAAPETGIFLFREDMEELYTLLRTKTKMKVVR
jgi:LysM repeat protein